MNISQQISSQIRVENMKILENPRNHSFFETTQLHDAGEFANFEICYHYVLRELRSFPCSIHPATAQKRLEIARESAFETGFGNSGDAHRPSIFRDTASEKVSPH